MKRKSGVIVAALVFALVASGVGFYANASGKDAKKGKAAVEKTAKENAPAEAAAAPDKAADEKSKNEKVAAVNDATITRGELDNEMGRYERQMSMMGRAAEPAQLAEMRKKVLDSLIGREVLRQESQKLGVTADDGEVDAQIAALKKRFPSEAEFTTTLGKMSMDEAQLKNQFNQDLSIKKMIDQQVASKVTITDEETKTFYDGNPDLFKAPEMVRASHILIKVDPKASAEDKAKAKEKIEAVQKRVQVGEDFAVLAKEVSECPSNANGGDLDFFQKGQMVGPFEDAAFALETGKVSDIVETQFGYHIIKVTDKKNAGVTPYEEIKGKIEQHLKQEKVQQQVAKYIEDLKSKSKIETFEK